MFRGNSTTQENFLLVLSKLQTVKSVVKREVFYCLLTECHIQSKIDSQWLYCHSHNSTNSFITLCHVFLRRQCNFALMTNFPRRRQKKTIREERKSF